MYDLRKWNKPTEAVQTFLDNDDDPALTNYVEQLASQSGSLDELVAKIEEHICQDNPLNDIEHGIYSILLKQVMSYVYWRSIMLPYWNRFNPDES